MKACGVSRADGDVVVLELPDPPPPGPGQILVAVEAAGVGAWDRLLGGGWDVGLRPPAALGVEGAGRVLAVGADVDEVTEVAKFAVGDRVLAHEAPLPGGSGFWAERVLLTAAHAASCPAGLQPVEAAALPVSGLTAGQALAMLGVGRGQRLLVTNGAGNTGSLAIQLAAAMGVEVTATASAAATDAWRRNLSHCTRGQPLSPAWPPDGPAAARSQELWYPARQISQVLSEAKNEPTTNCPGRTVRTSPPTSSTMPTYS
jgi:NADPH:quinone reductase-like Zn-dependent oxidoreductase